MLCFAWGACEALSLAPVGKSKLEDGFAMPQGSLAAHGLASVLLCTICLGAAPPGDSPCSQRG